MEGEVAERRLLRTSKTTCMSLQKLENGRKKRARASRATTGVKRHWPSVLEI